MSQPTACIRCKGTELAEATFEAAGVPRVVVDADHSSTVAARVCLSCGAILLTAVDPAVLRARPAPERHLQEFDF